jgi:hypothetical protein
MMSALAVNQRTTIDGNHRSQFGILESIKSTRRVEMGRRVQQIVRIYCAPKPALAKVLLKRLTVRAAANSEFESPSYPELSDDVKRPYAQLASLFNLRINSGNIVQRDNWLIVMLVESQVLYLCGVRPAIKICDSQSIS